MKKSRRYSFDRKRFTPYSIGGLWFNHQKVSPEHPDLMGELDVPKVLLDDLIDQIQSRGKAKISIAAWQNKSKEGEAYLTMTGKLPKATLKTCIRK